MELLLAVAVLVLFFTLCVVKLRRRDDGPRLPPGPLLPTFVRGNYVDAIAFRKLQQRYGDVVSFKMLGDTYVFLNSHEAIREAFVNQAEVFTGRPSNAILNCTQEGYGLIFTEGDLWRTHRRFLLSVLKDFGFGKTGTESIIQDELAQLRLQIEQADKLGPFFPQEMMSGAVANVVCSLVFSERCTEDAYFRNVLHMVSDCAEKIGPLVLTLSKYLRLLEWMPGDLLHIKLLVNNIRQIDEYVRHKLEQHKSTFDVNNPRDYIDMYLREMKEGRELFTEQQLQRVIFELFIAGMDSTATMLTWSVYFMARYPDIQKKVHDEISGSLASDSDPSMGDKGRLKYTCAVLCEVQRRAILVPFGGVRRACRDTVLCGFKIPKHAIVAAPQLTAHCDPTVWPFPDSFNPENFINPNTNELRNTEYLVTFSMGKRNCLGESLANQELFLFFVGLMQRFEFVAHDVPAADERFLCLPERRTPAFLVSARAYKQ